MVTQRAPFTMSVVRQVFETWSVCIPPTFEETFVREGYWHAWDETRSISITSVIVTNGPGEPPAAAEIAAQFAGIVEGEPIDALPPGVLGKAAVIETGEGSRASRAICALLVADNRVAITTVTSDDLDWAAWTLGSIRYLAPRVAAPGPLRPERRRRRGWDRRAN